ncbi:MAG: amidohydrolase [Steroidobacteraceae bacterium]
MRITTLLLLAGLLPFTLQAHAGDGRPTAAELVFVNGNIHTMDPDRPAAQGMAVAHGRLIAVGSNREMRRFRGAKTRQIDLQGRTVLPGLFDAHVHAARGAMEARYFCNFSAQATPSEIAAAVKRCVARTISGRWVIGGRWGSSFFSEHQIDSPREWLDELSATVPIVLRDDSGHNAWANSAALAAAQIEANTPDPEGGSFARAADGQLTGLVFELGAEKLLAAVPLPSDDEWRESIGIAQRTALSLGLVGLKEADTAENEVAAYHRADARGELQTYVMTCINAFEDQASFQTAVDIARLERIRDENRSAQLDTGCVKFYLDGVPTPARTAAMLAPYRPDKAGHVTAGSVHVEAAKLARAITDLDRRGFVVKMHAAGDGSVRAGLDAIAAARRANGPGGARHELGHAGFVDPADIGRFRELNAVAEFSPVIWYPSPIIDAVIDAVGERGRHYWPMRDLLASGAPVAAGSDWPSVVPSMDPWSGIEAMVTRADPSGARSGQLWPEQAITPAQALHIYTIDGARALRRDADSGSIATGKSADFIVVDQDPLAVAPSAIGDTRVMETWLQGRLAYARENGD